MVKQALVVATTITVALILGMGGLAVYRQGAQLKSAQAELAELRVLNSQGRERATALERDLARGQAEIASLRKEKEEVITQTRGLMEDQMREALKSKEVTISELEGRLTVNILDRILFDSAAADIKPEGRQVLDQIARVLTNYPNRQILVVGHTDDRPIRGSMRFPSNWELSTARATAAVRHLAEHAGVPPNRLGAIGYGEHHPIATNETPEGRARNRRIAVVIMPEGFRPFESNETQPSPTPPNPDSLGAQPAPSSNDTPAPAPTPATNQPAAATNALTAPLKNAPAVANTNASPQSTTVRVTTNFTRLPIQPREKPEGVADPISPSPQ